tara:strand:+ start:643 stop:1011 length:369 start_codon:yes stop_codon:yes gene_type:complete
MNKTDYENMSDFELNKLVAHEVYSDIGGQDYTKHLVVKYSYGEGCECISYCGGDKLDYCNNPNDMMPLVFEHKIGMQSPWNGSGVWRACNRGDDDFVEFDCSHANPLRAAAIVYLLLQDDKK